jgi:transposase
LKLSTKQQVRNSADAAATAAASSYTKEFKDQVVEVYNSGIYASMAECARSYKVPEKLFYQWAAASKKQTLPPEQATELIKLRKDNKRLNQEIDILKKAAAYFAKELK